MPVRFLVHVKRPSILPDKIAMCFYFCIYFFCMMVIVIHISISLAPLTATQATVKPQQSTINGISKLFLKGTPTPTKHIIKNPTSSKNPNAIFKTKAPPKTPVFRLETQTSNDLSKALAKPAPKPTTPKDSRKNKYVAGNVAITKVNTKLTGKQKLGTLVLNKITKRPYFVSLLFSCVEKLGRLE